MRRKTGIPLISLCLLLSMATRAAAGVLAPLREGPQRSSRVAAEPAAPSLLSGASSGIGYACFQDLCRCQNNVANCSSNNGRLLFIPRLPTRSRRLLFAFNDLDRINSSNFFQNVTGILSVDLSHNGLDYIHPDAFKRLPQLRTLILDHNRLTYPALVPVFSAQRLTELSIGHMRLGPVPQGIFATTPMPPLQVLNLTGNHIHHLNLSAFSPLSRLSRLAAVHCRITLVAGAFLPALTRLDLSANALFDLPPSCSKNGSSWMPHLQALYLAQNVFSKFDSQVCLPKLRTLDLSRNPIPAMRTDMFNGSRFPGLAALTLNSIQTIGRTERFAFRNPSLQSLSMMFCNLPFSDDFIHPDTFRGIPQLVYLQLSHNLGSYLPEEKFQQLFSHLETLQELNLGVSGIQFITENIFKNMSRLRKLSLYRNQLTEIPEGMFSSLKQLKELKLEVNQLRHVGESMFSVETRNRLTRLDLSGNPLICDCDVLWFREWLVSSPIFRTPHKDYNCSNIPRLPLRSFTMNPQACLLSQESYSAMTACFVVFFVLLSFVSAVHYYRWHIRLLLAFRGHSDLMRRRLQTQRFHYDVFVSFAGEDLPWVRQHLIPQLEESWGLRLCVHERDFRPGKNILNNIVDSVKASKRYMMLFSRDFVHSPWCQFELDLCLGHVMDYDDALIVTCLDDIASRDMTSTMTAVMKTTTYVQWRNTPDDVTLFWRRIGLAVRDLRS